ncbi:MAG: hypothetical protein GY898_28395 [Proteobacteria bacterium]|nr:hypothetical protein [Pseudomonadota bacterium]
MASDRRGGPGATSRAARNDQAPTTSSQDARGVAEEVGLVGDTRGATRGAEAGQQRSPRQAEEAREGVDAAAAADFASQLAEMAVADPSDPSQADKSSEQEEGFEEDIEVEVEVDGDDLDEARPARATTVLPGDEDDPDDANPVEIPPEDAPAAAPVGSPIPRIRPRARAAWLGIDEALQAGTDEAILVGHQGRVAVARIEELTTREWLNLVRAMRVAREPLAQAFVLKALGAHRESSCLPAFAARVIELGSTEAVRLQHARGPVPDGDAEARNLRLHYDPIEALDPKKVIHEAAPSDPWRVPAWLRGIPRAAMELAVVAVDQALTGDLREGETTDQGATDALTAALAPHGRAHPSLQRWTLNLAARAESHGALVRMRDVLMRARVDRTRS